MKSAKKMRIINIVLFIIFCLVFWGLAGNAAHCSDNDFTIVTTFTILADFAQNIAGPNNDVRVLSQIGAEVHEWELTARNFVDIEQADIVFYNGLNVEQWMNQVRSNLRSGVPLIAVGELCDYYTLPIIVGDYKGYPDPHIWMHPLGAISYVEVIRDALIEHNPRKASMYDKNASVYIEKIQELYDELQEILSIIPKDNRVLITTEAAFIYFADAYDFTHDAVWGTNTEEEGTPQQMMRIMRVVDQRKPAGIFWESTGSNRYALSISADTETPIFGPLYVDSVGELGSGAETYLNFMKLNSTLLAKVLSPKR